MASLMDRINQGLTSTPTPTQGPGQRQIESVLRAKGGKAGGGAAAPAATGLQAETAQQQAQTQLQQGRLAGALAGAQLREGEQAIAEQKELGEKELASKGKMARAQMQAESALAAQQRQAREEMARAERSADENMKLDQMEARATQRLRELETQRDVAFDDLFAEFDRSNKELAFRKDAAELEQLGFDLALSDRSYLDELNRIGRERMLTNDLQFAQESARITLGDNLEATLEEIDFLKDFNGDRRTYEAELQRMGIDGAMKIIQSATQAANQRALMEGVGELAGAGIEYGDQEGWFD